MRNDMSYQFDESYGLEYGRGGNIICNKKNRDILVTKIKELENLKKSSEIMNEEDNECPICMEPIVNGIVVLKCAHKLCPECYAKHSRVNNKCPMCRDEFSEKPKIASPMPDETRDSIVDRLFENTTDGEDKYFEKMATSIKMKSLEEATKSLKYLTKTNCKLTCIGVINWYNASNP